MTKVTVIKISSGKQKIMPSRYANILMRLGRVRFAHTIIEKSADEIPQSTVVHITVDADVIASQKLQLTNESASTALLTESGLVTENKASHEKTGAEDLSQSVDGAVAASAEATSSQQSQNTIQAASVDLLSQLDAGNENNKTLEKKVTEKNKSKNAE
jgi:hypothetical protein